MPAPTRVRRPTMPGAPSQAHAPEPSPAPEDPPQSSATSAHVERGEERHEVSPDFVARDGDTLVVTYPEVTLPLPEKFAMMKFGGLIYTRRLRDGDDPQEQLETIDRWLTREAERAGVAKYKRLLRDFLKREAKS